jgi:hypothetical protein
LWSYWRENGWQDVTIEPNSRTRKNQLRTTTVNQFQEDPNRIMEGIWLWTVPVYNDMYQTNLFFVELTGVEQGHPDYLKFMAVMNLICSSFVVITYIKDYLKGQEVRSKT